MPPKKNLEKNNSKNSENKSKKEYIQTDDKAQLLLEVAHDYKPKHLSEGTCWESVKTKYADIQELFRKELLEDAEQAQCLGKDYLHKPDEKTSKIKAIRIKFREVCPVTYYYSQKHMFCLLQAVDSGRRSGHGRVVYLYYELCEKLWGGSPATEQIEMGVEMEEVNDQQADAGERESGDFNHDNTEEQGSDNTSSQCSTREPSTSPDDSSSHKRREMLDETLSTYRHKRMKKRVSSDVQLL